MNAISLKDTRLVGVDDRGNRIGEDHPRAKLSNAEVDLIWELVHPTDGARPMSHRQVAAKFDISRGTVGDIVSCRRRSAYPTGYRRIPCTAKFVQPIRAAARLNLEL